MGLLVGIVAVVLLFFGGCYIFPQWNLWQSGLHGRAELQRAQWNRQIAVQEAHAKMESAKSLATADSIRAEGTAKANAILGESLKGNDEYLRYLWIQSLEHGGTAPTVVYVPTEAGLPITEAGKR